MREFFPDILLCLACLCILALAAISHYNLKEHKNDHNIHLQKDRLSEKEKLEIEILRERLRNIKKGTAEP